MVFTELCKHHHNLSLQHFYHPPKKPQYQLVVTPILSSLQPLATICLLLVSMDLPLLGISYKWNHITYGLLYITYGWLLSLGLTFTGFIHVVACISASFLLWLNNIPLWNTVWAVFTFWLLCIWIMLLWTFMYKFLCGQMFSFLWDRYPGMKLLGHVVTLFYILRNCQTIFQSDSTILHFHQWGMRVPISPHPYHLLLSVFWL